MQSLWCCSLVCVHGTLVKVPTQSRTKRGGVDEGGGRPNGEPSFQETGGRGQGLVIRKETCVSRTAQIEVQAVCL